MRVCLKEKYLLFDCVTKERLDGDDLRAKSAATVGSLFNAWATAMNIEKTNKRKRNLFVKHTFS